MTTKDYVEYLLKHRRMLERDLERMGKQMLLLQCRSKAKSEGAKTRNSLKRQGSIFYEIYRRAGSVSYDEVKEMHDALALELQQLCAAVEALDAREKKVIQCIYEQRLTWAQTGAQLFLSRNTVARSRTRALNFIIASFEACSNANETDAKQPAAPCI